MNFSKLQELGVSDYYFDLKKYIFNFINENCPLTMDDMRALSSNESTSNTRKRQELFDVMKNEFSNIINKKIAENTKFISEGRASLAINRAQYEQEIFNYKQQMLEKLYEYNNEHTKNTYIDDTMSAAMQDGISAETVKKTLTAVLDKTDALRKNPSQLLDTFSAISDAKGNVVSANNSSYSSKFMNDNGGSIESAISFGISSDELTSFVNKESLKSNSRNLEFGIKLFSAMKEKELKLNKSYQKVLKNVDL